MNNMTPIQKGPGVQDNPNWIPGISGTSPPIEVLSQGRHSVSPPDWVYNQACKLSHNTQIIFPLL